MNKVIFGSGIVGLLAKEILGQDWKLVPFSRSRFYSFSPALDDNFIIRDERIDNFIEHLGGKPAYIYKVSYSVEGQLETYSEPICRLWLAKIFGADAPAQAVVYMKGRTGFFVYDIKINRLYEMLQNKHAAELENHDAVTKIGEHFYETSKGRHEFAAAVNTIPLKAILTLCGLKLAMDTGQVWYFHIKTPDLDFEGSNQILVVDPEISFYKVNHIAKNRYIFHCTQDIPVPGPYFSQFMQRFDLLDGTTIDDVLPTGSTPNLDPLKKLGITCVGSSAEHDWCADVGSNIMRLLKLKSELSSQ